MAETTNIDESMCLVVDPDGVQLWPRCDQYPRCPCGGPEGNQDGSTTLGDDLPRVMAYVRDELIPMCEQMGADGALAMMRRDLDLATAAISQNDIGGMRYAYKSLCEYRE